MSLLYQFFKLYYCIVFYPISIYLYHACVPHLTRTYLNVYFLSFLSYSVRSSTTTMVIDGRSGDGSSRSAPKKNFMDHFYTTFSSPIAWVLVLALVITWSCVFVIMFDMMDYKTLSGKDDGGEDHQEAELVLFCVKVSRHCDADSCLHSQHRLNGGLALTMFSDLRYLILANR